MHGFSLLVAKAREGYSVVAVQGLVLAVASLVTEHGARAHGLQKLWFPGSSTGLQQFRRRGIVAPRHVGSLLYQGLNSNLLHQQVGFLTNEPPGKPRETSFSPHFVPGSG